MGARALRGGPPRLSRATLAPLSRRALTPPSRHPHASLAPLSRRALTPPSRQVPIKKTLSSLSVVSAVLGLSQLLLITHANRDLGIDDKWFTFGDDLILTVLGQVRATRLDASTDLPRATPPTAFAAPTDWRSFLKPPALPRAARRVAWWRVAAAPPPRVLARPRSQLAFMPLLVLAASLCPPGVEGTLFALLMSIFNGGGIVGMELGALLTSALGVSSASEGGPTDFTNLGLLVIICNLSSLLPLLAIGWLDEVEATHADGSSADGPGAAATAAATPAVAVGDALVAGQSGQPGALASAASAVEPSPANLGEAPAAVASDANASRDRHA